MKKELINVLLIESRSSDQHVKQTLRSCSEPVKFIVESTDDLAASIDLLGDNNFDIILLDLELPGAGGVNAVKKIRSVNSNIPIIVMTESDNDRLGVKAIKNGADDYLVRGKIFHDVLTRSIRYTIVRQKDRIRTEGKLSELIKQLETANTELTDFVYIVSHDLKAPLRGIKTLAQWLINDYADKLDEQGKEQMAMLASRVDRMHNLIEGVLAYSRVGRNSEEPRDIDLNQLLPEIIESIAPESNIEIEVESNMPTIVCEQTPVVQIFQNLIGNAVKFMDKPNGKIKVGCDGENGFWKFNVSDNGPGIEEKDFERIFKIFQTLTPRDEFESTGVGLTVTKKIVESFGGTVWVESKAGDGSTFFFTLPRSEKASTLQTVDLADHCLQNVNL